jgi:hypothetical protein
VLRVNIHLLTPALPSKQPCGQKFIKSFSKECFLCLNSKMNAKLKIYIQNLDCYDGILQTGWLMKSRN